MYFRYGAGRARHLVHRFFILHNCFYAGFVNRQRSFTIFGNGVTIFRGSVQHTLYVLRGTISLNQVGYHRRLTQEVGQRLVRAQGIKFGTHFVRVGTLHPFGGHYLNQFTDCLTIFGDHVQTGDRHLDNGVFKVTFYFHCHRFVLDRHTNFVQTCGLHTTRDFGHNGLTGGNVTFARFHCTS